MAESFLALVATLVTDRRHTGHTVEENIRQEIVQRLAVRKMTYSEFGNKILFSGSGRW